MKHMELPLKIQSSLPLSVNTQIKEQIKVLIAKKFLQPGDYLPSTNQLAQLLSLNKNTILGAYTQLKDEGLLETGKGIGTRVANEQQIAKHFKDDAYLALVQEIVEKVSASEYSVENILLSGIAYNQLYDFSESNKKRYLFIECKKSACHFYIDEIIHSTNAIIDSVDTKEVSTERLQHAIDEADVVITQNNILENLNRRVSFDQTKVIGVSSSGDINLLFKMIQD